MILCDTNTLLKRLATFNLGWEVCRLTPSFWIDRSMIYSILLIVVWSKMPTFTCGSFDFKAFAMLRMLTLRLCLYPLSQSTKSRRLTGRFQKTLSETANVLNVRHCSTVLFLNIGLLARAHAWQTSFSLRKSKCNDPWT